MSKKLPTKTRKRKNYRLRKSVRRTLGALFLISAIVVAAIPFPDAAAADPDAGATTTATSLTYGVNKDDNINTVNGQKVNLSGTGNQAFYTLRRVDNVWRYEKMFDYYTITSPTLGAVLSDYNDMYLVEDLTLPGTITSGEYVHIDKGTYDQYFNNTSASVTLNYSQIQSDEGAKFKYFFPAKYKQLEEGKGIPTSVTATINEIDSGKRGAYYSENVEITIGQKKQKFPGTTSESGGIYSYQPAYTLVEAEKPKLQQDGTPDPAGGVDVILVLQAVDRNVNVESGFRKDDHNFIYSILDKSYDLVGIGDNAFDTVTNGMSLTLPDRLLYIGDSAFANSYVTTIKLTNVKDIGNYAFKNSRLEQVEFSNATMRIGTEAFSETSLSSVKFPFSINTIGEGAFANNDKLTTITFDATSNLNIKAFAFYNCPNLNSLDLSKQKITSIGKGAFALGKVDEGKLTSFKFPNDITAVDSTNSGTGLGDYIFYGRTALKEVTMPSNLGYTAPVELPENLFANCTGLSYVEFPETCRFTTFPETLFSTVTNPDFYVKGPKLDGSNKPAKPRESTWKCKMAGDKYVPYVYEENGKRFYEVSDGKYLLSIDEKGVLQSGSFFDPNAQAQDVEIPGTVGNIPVSSFAEGCFDATFLSKIQKFTISDGGNLKEIGDGVFKGSSMTSLYIGDSVEKIGAEAFKDCKALTNVTIGKNIKQIGASAFENCATLTQVHFMEPDNLTDFKLANIGQNAFTTNSGELTLIGSIGPDYAPFAWAMQPDNYVVQRDGIRVCYKTPAANYLNVIADNLAAKDPADIKPIPTELTVILDNKNNYPTLVDYQHYEDIDDAIRKAYEKGEVLEPANERLILSALNINLPEGIKSIDAKGFFTNSSKETPDASGLTNMNSVAVYFSSVNTADPTKGGDDSQDLYQNYGLFAGYYGTVTDDKGNKREFPVGDPEEMESKGNDRIRTISMPSVVYIPDGAFDDCENLETIQIGDQIEELGALPFSNCTSLSSIGFGNDNFVCNNGIVYENNADGTKTIVEGLASRGTVVGSSTINLQNDPDLASVSEIRNGAFSNCKQITSFDLTGTTGIAIIPEECFLGAEFLNTVDLPQSIRKIGDKAFATGGNYLKVVVRGREVGLGDNAFGEAGVEEERVKQPYLVSYEDTAVRLDAKSQGVNVDETLDETFTFKFYDETGLVLLKTDFVEKGGTAEAPEDSEIPVIAGKTFKGWNKSLKNIQSDDFTLAVYTGSGTGGDGNGGTGTGGNGTGGTGTGNGTGTGTGTGGTNVNGGIDTDGDGIADVDKNGNKLYTLTVTGGNGSGRYAAGTKVSILATGGSTGSTFGYWSSSNTGVIFDDSTKPTTSLVMPASDATVIANYVGQYRLEVKYGSGSGSYAAGAKVTISAVDAPAGKKFYRWSSSTSGLSIESSTSATTTITMPAANATVEATYSNTGTSGGSGSAATTGSSSTNKTSVIITRPGISDTDQASAYVSGSSDGFIVKITESAEATEAALAALQNEYGDMTPIKFAAMDISLYDSTGTQKITDTTGLKINITMPIPDALRAYAGNNKIAGIVNGSLDKLGVKFVTMNGVPCMSFTATHFSPYVVYVDTGNLAAGDVLDSTPKTGDGIHPKWFLSIGLASISMILFLKRDPKYKTKLS